MPRIRPLFTIIATLAAGAALAAPAGSAAAGTDSRAGLQIPAMSGSIGRFDDSAIVKVRQRCAKGLTVRQLKVQVTQGPVAGTRSGKFGAVCDGKWRTLTVEVASSTGDEYEPGPVAVLARLSVLNPKTRRPLPDVTAKGTVTLRPQVELKIGVEGSVGQFETTHIPIIYRCDSPWIVSGLSINVSQGELNGTYFTDQGLVCDNVWHHRTVVMSSSTGGSFLVGHADVEAVLDIQDPEQFDPVGQAAASKRLWIAPAASAKVVNAVLNPDHSATVTLSLRCQRPWIVQEWGASIAQNEGRIYGYAYSDTGVVCDQAWRTVQITVVGSSPFVRGPAEVSAGISLLDPEHFDPVGAASDTRTLRF